MFAGNFTSKSKDKLPTPPPLPPKPFPLIHMNPDQLRESGQPETASKSNEQRFILQRYFSSKTDTYSPVEVRKNCDTVDSYGSGVSGVNFTQKYDSDFYHPPQPDNNTDCNQHSTCSTQPSPKVTSSNGATNDNTTTTATSTSKYSQISIKATPSTKINLHYSTGTTTYEDGLLLTDNIKLNYGNEKLTSISQHRSNEQQQHTTTKPIVTESPEESNNNIIVKKKRAANTSTVEILEVPTQRNLSISQPAHNITETYGNYSKRSTTFSRTLLQQQQQQQQQLFFENNNYAAPVVTTATDDEEDYDGGNNCDENIVELLSDMEVDSVLSESSRAYPPKTSTPSKSETERSVKINNNSPNSTCQAETISIEQRSKRREDLANESDEDALNISRETDELTNTSALNLSGGGEIIGINDISYDKANSSKDSQLQSKFTSETHDGGPCTVNVVNDSKMYTPTSSNLFTNLCSKEEYQVLQKQNQNSSDISYQSRISELEKLSSSLIDEVNKLKNLVLNLSSKVNELEAQVDKQHQQQVANSKHDLGHEPCTSRSVFSLSSSRSKNHDVPEHSLSTSTINKLTSRHDPLVLNPDSTSTYVRSHIATITNRANDAPLPHSNSCHIPKSKYGGASKNSTSQSCNNTVTKSRQRLTDHASTNSLYAESHKSGSTSNSPTFNNRHYVRTNSPNASSMTLNANRRDPATYNSMLSLTSLGGQSATSTLKKSTAGSVSNLSQACNQLAQWPSMSDFITLKHRGKEILFNEDERLIRMVLYNRIIDMRLPNWVSCDYEIDNVLDAPNVRIKLDWVYGYRGRDCRTNIFYVPTGECVYFVASIVVLYNLKERTQRHYLGHTDSVKCLAVHPNKLIIASGQSSIQNRRDKRPIVRVWNTVSLTTLRIIAFNEEIDSSICCLAFSKNDQGATLAVVDESHEHTITLLDWQRERNWRLAETNSGHEPVLAIDFHPIDKHTLVAVGKSTINFWDTRGMTMTKKTGLFDKYDKPKYVLCLAFNDQGDTVTGDSNGNIIIWPKGCNRPQRVIHDVHIGGVFSILAMKDSSYLTGGRDRRIIEWDENFNRTGREAELPEHCGGVRYITYANGSQVLIGTLRNSILFGSFETNFTLIMQGHSEATSALAIHPKQNQYLTGGFDDQIHLFTTQTHEVNWSKCLMMPATAASFSPNGLLVVVGSTLGKWLVLDAISQEILFTKCDGSGTINCIKFSPNGEYFAMGSSDAHIYIYQTTEAGNKFCRMGTCVGHSTPIKEIDWSDDSRYLQAQSMNLELLFWRASNCRPLDDLEIIDDLKWFTHNCTIGFSVMGIWSDSIDSALINYCDKSNAEQLLVSVTDAGSINVFRWPPCYNQCLSQKQYGNVEKFDFIKFLPDDSKLIAIGAKNCVTTEWTVDIGKD